MRQLVNTGGTLGNIGSTTGEVLTFNGVDEELVSLATTKDIRTVMMSLDNIAGGSVLNHTNAILDNGGVISIDYDGSNHDTTIASTSVGRLAIVDNHDEMRVFFDGVYIESLPSMLIPFGNNIINLMSSGGSAFASGSISNVKGFVGVYSDAQILSEYESPETALYSDYNGVYSNPYLEEVNISPYNEDDPSHIIVTGANFLVVFDDIQYSHYYMTAGDLFDNPIILTRSGTADDRLTISLYDDGIIHPSRLADNEQASCNIRFEGASYWTLSRLSAIDSQREPSFYLINSTGVILDQMHLKNYYYGITLDDEVYDSCVQNSYLNGMTHEGRLSDNVGWAMNTTADGTRCYNNKLINCEIRNAGDGLQLVRDGSDDGLPSSQPDLAYDGTIIDSNRIWCDSDIYSDGLGNYDPSGEYMIAENAMDFKVCSNDALNPVVITNNVMWGLQPGDEAAGGAISNDRGLAVSAHFGAMNVVFENNIIYKCGRAFIASGRITAFDFTLFNWSMKHNIFADIGIINPEDTPTYAVNLFDTASVFFEQNVFHNCVQDSSGEGWAFRYEYPRDYNNTFNDNVLIDSNGTSTKWEMDDPDIGDSVSIVNIDNNYFYNSVSGYGGEPMGGTNQHDYVTAAEANMATSNFDTSILSTPKADFLDGTKTTASSPHYASTGIVEDKDSSTFDFAIPLLEGVGVPSIYQNSAGAVLTASHSDINSSWSSGATTGLQKIGINADITMPDTMGFSDVQADQVVMPVPSTPYSIVETAKIITSSAPTVIDDYKVSFGVSGSQDEEYWITGLSSHSHVGQQAILNVDGVDNGLTIEYSGLEGVNSDSIVSGDNSGYLRDSQMANSFYNAFGTTQEYIVAGLNDSSTYTFRLSASRASTENRETEIVLGGVSKIYTTDDGVTGNITDGVEYTDLVPVGGAISFTATGVMSYSYVGGIDIKEIGLGSSEETEEVTFVYTDDKASGLHLYKDGIEQPTPTAKTGDIIMDDVALDTTSAVLERRLYEVHSTIIEP